MKPSYNLSSSIYFNYFIVRVHKNSLVTYLLFPKKLNLKKENYRKYGIMRNL